MHVYWCFQTSDFGSHKITKNSTRNNNYNRTQLTNSENRCPSLFIFNHGPTFCFSWISSNAKNNLIYYSYVRGNLTWQVPNKICYISYDVFHPLSNSEMVTHRDPLIFILTRTRIAFHTEFHIESLDAKTFLSAWMLIYYFVVDIFMKIF